MAFSISFGLGSPLLSRLAPSQAAEPACAENPSIRVRVYPQWYKFVSVEWTVPAAWGDCRFNVYFSQSEDIGFEKLNTSPINGNSLVDYTTQEYSKFHNGYYIVEAILLDGGGKAMRSKPTSWFNKQRRWVELRSIEVQRREYWLLSKFGGVKTYLFKKRMYGKRCPNCWDAYSETVIKDRCTVCYGTSFEGGYFPPLPLYVQYETTPNNRVKSYFGNFEPNSIGAWTISMPEISPEDVLVRIGDWNVYKVAQVQTTELQANVVRQMLTVTQMGKRDIEHELVTKRLAEFPLEYGVDQCPDIDKGCC